MTVVEDPATVCLSGCLHFFAFNRPPCGLVDLVGNENKARGAATTRKQKLPEAAAGTRRLTSPEQRHLTWRWNSRGWAWSPRVLGGDGEMKTGPLPTGDGLEKRRQPSAKFRQFYGNGAAFWRSVRHWKTHGSESLRVWDRMCNVPLVSH